MHRIRVNKMKKLLRIFLVLILSSNSSWFSLASANQIEEKAIQIVTKNINVLADKEAIIYPAKNEKYRITVFTDISCRFCRLFHQEMNEYNKLGITVRYLAYPRAGIQSPTANKMRAIWCNRHQKAILTKAYDDPESVPDFTCDLQRINIEKHILLADELGLIGTPMIVLADGRFITGYLTASVLKTALDEMIRVDLNLP